MTRPEKVNLTCPHCGYTWLEPTTTLMAANVVVYKGDDDIVKRRVSCPNCDRGVIVDVSKTWLEHE